MAISNGRIFNGRIFNAIGDMNNGAGIGGGLTIGGLTNRDSSCED